MSANSTINVSYSGGATMGTLAIGGNTLTVTNLSGGGATLALAPRRSRAIRPLHRRPV